MANQNGLAGQNAGAFNNINAPAAIPAGFYADMQFLDRNMDSLTSAINENRNEWSQIEDLLARASRLHIRPRDGPSQLTNGTSTDDPQGEEPTREQLQIDLDAAKAAFKALKEEDDQIMGLYDEKLEEIIAKMHTYGASVQKWFGETVSHYNALLEKERGDTLDARLEHQEWQARFQQLSEGVRAALRAREEEGMPWKRRIAALKEENRILRAKVGWDPPVDSDDDEQGGPEESPGGAQEQQRGRTTQPAQQVTVNVQEVPP